MFTSGSNFRWLSTFLFIYSLTVFKRYRLVGMFRTIRFIVIIINYCLCHLIYKNVPILNTYPKNYPLKLKLITQINWFQSYKHTIKKQDRRKKVSLSLVQRWEETWLLWNSKLNFKIITLTFYAIVWRKVNMLVFVFQDYAFVLRSL